jgi:hypothetical protein
LVIPAVFTLVDDIPAALKWVWHKLTGRLTGRKSVPQGDLNIAINK